MLIPLPEIGFPPTALLNKSIQPTPHQRFLISSTLLPVKPPTLDFFQLNGREDSFQKGLSAEKNVLIWYDLKGQTLFWLQKVSQDIPSASPGSMSSSSPYLPV